MFFILKYYDFGDRSSFVGFSFVQMECVTRLVHEFRAVFRLMVVSSAQGPLFLLYPQDLAAAANIQDPVLPLSRLSNSGAVVKGVVMIFILLSRGC